MLFLDVIISGNKFTNSNITRFNFYTDYSKLNKITWAISLVFDFLQCVNGMLYVDYKDKGYTFKAITEETPEVYKLKKS